MKARDKQVGGRHYKDMAIQPGDFIKANGLGWYEGNAVKYICRHKVKGGRLDLEKAIHYLQLEIEDSYVTKKARRKSKGNRPKNSKGSFRSRGYCHYVR